jgi:arylsulfatase A-like enzyme
MADARDQRGTGDRPNVLIILCDQLRRDLLGAYGGTLVRTPDLDALAADGIVFDRMYTPTGICSPARASLMTGLYAHAHHMFNNSTPRYSYCQHLRPDVMTLATWADERTAIFFTTDHGDMAGSHGFTHKGAYMYEELNHTPLLFKPAWPSSARPARVAEPVHLMDVAATALHLMAGEEQRRMGEPALHGASLQPFAEGTARWEREVHYAEYHGDWYGHQSLRMVTDGRWKLVWSLSDLGELYDLEAAPHELRNRYYDPACAGGIWTRCWPRRNASATGSWRTTRRWWRPSKASWAQRWEGAAHVQGRERRTGERDAARDATPARARRGGVGGGRCPGGV